MLISKLIRGGVRWYLLPFYNCRLAIDQLLAVASNLRYKHEHITQIIFPQIKPIGLMHHCVFNE